MIYYQFAVYGALTSISRYTLIQVFNFEEEAQALVKSLYLVNNYYGLSIRRRSIDLIIKGLSFPTYEDQLKQVVLDEENNIISNPAGFFG